MKRNHFGKQTGLVLLAFLLCLFLVPAKPVRAAEFFDYFTEDDEYGSDLEEVDGEEDASEDDAASFFEDTEEGDSGSGDSNFASDAASPDASELFSAGGYQYVADGAGILDEDEKDKLESRAEEIASGYNIGVYIVTVPDFRAYSTEDVFHAAIAIYKANDLGYGDGKNGVLLLLSMADRDYNLLCNGDWGNEAFTDAGREAMTAFFLDDFHNNDWYAGFSDYLTWTDKYLAKAEAGKPYDSGNLPLSTEQKVIRFGIVLGVLLLVPVIIASIVTAVQAAKMKSVAKATRASAYAKGGLQLTGNADIYTHTTEHRTRIERDIDSGGGPVSSHDGSFSGTSGKF